MHAFLNPAVRRDAEYRGVFSEADYAAVDAFYEAQQSLRTSPLRELPALAASLGLAALMVKDESGRFGLSAFKSLGARYAMERLGRVALDGGVVCATAGNHGRAVARAARDMRVRCTVFVPALGRDAPPSERTVRDARVAGMRDDGADVVEVDGTYEEAVELAAMHGLSSGATIVSDTAWPGYESIPRDVMAGYTRLFTEASAQWTLPPDVVVVQAGVGGLLCAGASWFAFHQGAERPYLIGCEPEGFACLLESARRGGPARLDPAGARTIMAGLRCAEPSHAAWPAIRDGVDAFVSIPDSYSERAMARLSAGHPQIEAGPSGACGVGALLAIQAELAFASVRDACGLGGSTRVLAIVTEGK